MKNLLRALQVFLKYGNHKYPTSCDHDVMYIMGINIADVSSRDIKKLDELGFFWSDGDECFMSFFYGSA